MPMLSSGSSTSLSASRTTSVVTICEVRFAAAARSSTLRRGGEWTLARNLSRRAARTLGVRSRVSAAVFAAAVAAGAAAPGLAAPLEGDALPAHVASFVAGETKGVLGTATETTQKISAPIFGGTTKIRRYIVFHDGIPVAAGVVSVEKNGKSESAESVARLSAEADAKMRSGTGFIHQPYVAQFVREYRYTSVPCEGCAAGESALRFESDHRDLQHLSG